MNTTITYLQTGTKERPGLSARFDGPLPARPEQLALLEREALSLLPRMRNDILSDSNTWTRPKPESYQQFNALMFLAAADDPEYCPNDYRRLWIEKDGAADGEEPAPGFYGCFEIDWQAIRIQITYTPDCFWLKDHLAIESMAPAKDMLPVTKTGYRSHFLSRAELIDAGSVQAFVTAWLDAADTPEYRARRIASKQLSLF